MRSRSAVGPADSFAVREAALFFGDEPRGGPVRVLGKRDPQSHGVKWEKIRVYVGPRKALRV